MRSTNKPPSEQDIREIRARWRNRHEIPISLNELAREYRRCDRTIKQIILSGGQDVPSRRFRSDAQKRRQAAARVGRSIQLSKIDELIAHARTCPTNQRIRELMEAPR